VAAARRLFEAACALLPPIPNALTAARRGSRRPSTRRAGSARKGLDPKSIWGFGDSKYRLGGISRFSRQRTVLMRPATPAAASRWPMFVFTEPIAQ
jgi:hypothetical protein